MSRNAHITLEWADGTYEFRLGWGELSMLQEACDAGPFVILDRLQGGAWKIEDISNVIRCGRIGAGAKPVEALKQVRAYVEARPPAENLLIAITVLKVGVFGAPEEGIEKKSEAPDLEGSVLTTSPTENSGSEQSTEPEAA